MYSTAAVAGISTMLYLLLCMCVCVLACVRVCVRVCVRSRVREGERGRGAEPFCPYPRVQASPQPPQRRSRRP